MILVGEAQEFSMLPRPTLKTQAKSGGTSRRPRFHEISGLDRLLGEVEAMKRLLELDGMAR
ncbi:MAG: hypothetical protein R3242_02070 [Akkermansiaceae bacterium]|nr:hypothetical protein [Akkermansiaceae bacterium]